MAKFKVGDEVSLGRMKAKVIHIESTGDFPYLVERADNRIEFCNDAELYPLLPAIPSGWTPADEPPRDDRNVRVTLNDGREWYGWWSVSFCKWRVYEDDANEKTITSKPEEYCSEIHEADDGEVIAWREIEPERKADPRVRYCVAADLPTSITVWHDSYDAAEAEAKRLCVKCGKPFRVLKVVAEVKNGAARKTRKEKLMWLVLVESTDDVIDRFSTYEEAFAVACDFTKRYEQAVIRLEE